MARLFTSRDAKQKIEKHLSLLKELKAMDGVAERLKSEIKDASNKLAAYEMLGVLRGIPVEELNRDKLGIRTKALRDCRYTTMADVYTASVYDIASIRGISEDSAYTIKRIARSFAEKTQREIKVRLSADNRNKHATQLILAISKYKNSIPHAEACRDMLLFKEEIENAIVDLRPATSDLKWFFSSQAKKTRAEKAYIHLNALLSSKYGTDSTECLRAFDMACRTTASEAWDDFTQNAVRFYTILEDINPGLLGTDDAVYGLPEELAREVQDECIFPDGLLCTLRRYQEWGVKYILHQERVLLGDEMGLGKTIQAIATMVSLKNTGATHFLVVCPASVVTNWCREIQRHSVLSVTKIHGVGRRGALSSWLKTGGVAVTTFETTGFFALDEKFNFNLLIVDEAHYIKNPEAKRTINTKKLCAHADRLLFMTGTALEN